MAQLTSLLEDNARATREVAYLQARATLHHSVIDDLRLRKEMIELSQRGTEFPKEFVGEVIYWCQRRHLLHKETERMYAEVLGLDADEVEKSMALPRLWPCETNEFFAFNGND